MAEICPHCDTCMSRKSYDAHKRLYYDVETGEWLKKRRLITDDQCAELVSTEQAMEECDFDLDLAFVRESSHNDEPSDRPPLVEFTDADDEQCEDVELNLCENDPQTYSTFQQNLSFQDYYYSHVVHSHVLPQL